VGEVKFLGSEPAGKTVGIVGLGQVGSCGGAGARLQARVIAYDPYPADRAKELSSAGELSSCCLLDISFHATAAEKGKAPSGARARE
jgi:lactate dehydrogenase-like 2-hydroxyacid dehydrogenase